MSSQAKRMQLTRDQRAVLEAVYAIEKLPDAALRERLGCYLNLTARQIQVHDLPAARCAKGVAFLEGAGSSHDRIASRCGTHAASGLAEHPAACAR